LPVLCARPRAGSATIASARNPGTPRKGMVPPGLDCQSGNSYVNETPLRATWRARRSYAREGKCRSSSKRITSVLGGKWRGRNEMVGSKLRGVAAARRRRVIVVQRNSTRDVRPASGPAHCTQLGEQTQEQQRLASSMGVQCMYIGRSEARRGAAAPRLCPRASPPLNWTRGPGRAGYERPGAFLRARAATPHRKNPCGP
jgi:hypothetical protein